MIRISFALFWGLPAAFPLMASPLTGHMERSSPQDLEVTLVTADGASPSPVFYTYQQLSTLPQVTVKTAKDPNTLTSATYTGVYISDLIAGLGGKPDNMVLTTTCYDGYQQFYDAEYDARHHPILLLKFDGKTPADWPKSDQNTPQGPYSIVYQNFVSQEKIYKYEETSRIPYGVVSARLLTHEQFFDAFTPKTGTGNPDVQKGQRIAMGSCISCHNVDENGGALAQRPWQLLATYAATSPDHFRDYIVNPQKFNPATKMTAHPTYDAKTLDALQAYFKTMLPSAK